MTHCTSGSERPPKKAGLAEIATQPKECQRGDDPGEAIASGRPKRKLVPIISRETRSRRVEPDRTEHFQ